jgi:hypothetical protein
MAGSSHSFTISAERILHVIETDASIGSPFELTHLSAARRMCRFRGVWDTGATRTVITQKVVDDCDLRPIGMQNVYTTAGLARSELYLISIFLPNNVGFSAVKVAKGNLGTTDLLIGMDIISSGDFALTHKGGKTTFSFRYPSLARVDFLSDPFQA